MISNNGLTICKSKYLSFINKWMLIPLLLVLLLVLAPCSCLMIAYWSNMPIIVKIFMPPLLAVSFLGTVSAPLNGMVITKKGKILFLPGIRLIRSRLKDMDRISITFNGWENARYSASVKLVHKNGKVFKLINNIF